MPAVVLPPPANGAARHLDNMSAQQIKGQSVEAVQRESKGAGALALIKQARIQIVAAHDYEGRGDLKNALASYAKCGALVVAALNSTEYKREPATGLVHKECLDFQKTYSTDMAAKMSAIEERLRAMDKVDSKADEDKPIRGIQARIQALKNSGLDIAADPPPSPKASTVPHTFVSPSSFGPPSPVSTPSSSPVHTFTPSLPSAPMAPSRSTSISSTEAKFPSISELDETFPAPKQIPDYNFLPVDRPSSTPVTPTTSSFVSRPASPAKPPKPTGLSSPAKSPLPTSGSVFAKDLKTYLRDHKVLMLDVRNRAEFERAHIKAEAVVCVEPVVLTRPGLDAAGLEDSMFNAPPAETAVFKNRDKFDLIVLYDQSSTSFGTGNTPMSTLFRLIYEQAFTKVLKHMPMLLVGGLDAWRREIGDAEMMSSPPLKSSTPTSTPILNGINSASSMSNGVNGTANNPFTRSPLLSNGFSSTSGDSHQLWMPRSRADTNSTPQSPPHHRPTFSFDQSQAFGHARAPAEISYPSSAGLVRRPEVQRAPPSSGPSNLPHSIPENFSSPSPSGSITYPSFAPRMTSSPSLPTLPSSSSPSIPFTSPSTTPGLPISPAPIASPPLASINPALSRRRSDFVDQSMETLSIGMQRSSIDYSANNMHIIRPPPVAASSALDRQERATPRSLAQNNGLSEGRINSDYAPTYWHDVSLGTSGLKNLGNTCYMNAPIQCLSATFPFAQFFATGRWRNAVNRVNPLGSQGRLSGEFANLVYALWSGELPYIIPLDFRKVICQLDSQYNGSNQHDSQEFLSFLLDGIHEDLNRILAKPDLTKTPAQEEELERLSTQVASEQEWRLWKTRNDSIIVDFFQGQFRNRMQCLTCTTTSTTYNVFSILQLPIPHSRSSKVPLQHCMDAFFNSEILEKEDAWDCPKCKVKRRASKQLSLARLPPILVIHLKRFEIKGRFSDKMDTFVEYPLKGLDLTNFMPPPLPPGADKGRIVVSPDDPRSQQPPYRYNLYGVTNHTGNLTSGHYTAFIADRDGWKSCDDSSIRPVDEKQVVNQRAYVLFYKRTKNYM